MMRRTVISTISLVGLLALLVGVSLLAAGSASASHVTVFTAGVNDNFALPTEPTSPSADLLALMDPYGGGDRVRFPHRQFDDVHIDRVFGHTFTNLPPCIVAATLEIRIFWGGGNDALYLERTGINDNTTAWGKSLSELFGPANLGSAETFILDLANLPPGDSQRNIIPFMNADHALDVYVQDDSGVDYMILTVETRCDVDIDIKPRSDPNSINSQSQGTIPVAILSTGDFDAPNQVNKTSLTFGRTGDERSLSRCTKSAEDVNDDGRLDLVCHFNTQDTGFQVGDSVGILKGLTVDGVHIEGRDSVRIMR